MLKPKRCKSVTLDPKRWVVPVTLALVCTFGLGTAQAANIVASETTADVATLVGTQFDVTPFVVSSSILESATGAGVFIANSTATGLALVVLTEGPGGANSDWFELIYSGTGAGAPESVVAQWRSDSDPGGLPPLPLGVTPQFLAETGGSQDITALLGASATASGFTFPSNITVQVQSDAPEPVPEPASLTLLSVAIAGFGGLGMLRRRKRA
jgi:hypothetical protein